MCGYAPVEAHFRALIDGDAARLQGEAALDVDVAIVQQMEDSGRYIAGRGAAPNSMGEWELDARSWMPPAREPARSQHSKASCRPSRGAVRHGADAPRPARR